MKKSMLVITGLALAACAEDPSKNAPKAGAATPASTVAAVAIAAAGETLPIDTTRSSLRWTGSRVTKTHPGAFKTFGGAITLVDGKAEASKVEIDIDTTSITTDKDRLIAHLKSPEFFDVEKYPTAKFSSTAITPGGTDGATHTVKGNLTLHGVTKEITFPATITVGEKEVTAKSRFSLNRKDFGIVYPGAPDDLIRDDVLVEWDIVANRG